MKVVLPLPNCGSCDCAFMYWNGRKGKGGLAISCMCSMNDLRRGLKLLSDAAEVDDEHEHPDPRT